MDRIAGESGFSGVVRVDRRGDVALAKAYGWANRALQLPATVDGQFAIASGTKGLTALTVMSLIEEGLLEFGTTARSVLGNDLPLIGDDVTVEHLLSHRSGIGDYIDEDGIHDITDHILAVPVHELVNSEDYLKVLDGHATTSAAGERFAYNNGGYVVLALIAERATGTPFREIVDQRVCRPAGMTNTAFLRSDELPARAAVGYLTVDGPRTNVFHLPVRGTGDGGDVLHRLRKLNDQRLAKIEPPRVHLAKAARRRDAPLVHHGGHEIEPVEHLAIGGPRFEALLLVGNRANDAGVGLTADAQRDLGVGTKVPSPVVAAAGDRDEEALPALEEEANVALPSEPGAPANGVEHSESLGCGDLEPGGSRVQDLGAPLGVQPGPKVTLIPERRWCLVHQGAGGEVLGDAIHDGTPHSITVLWKP